MMRGALRISALALSCAMATSLSTPASALSIFGWTLFEDQAQKDADAVIADPQRYDIEIIVDDEELEDAVRNASALWSGRDAPASGAAGLLATARADYRRILAALYAQGHYGGSIVITVDGQEPNDLPPDADLGDPAIVAVRVEAGPVFAFGQIDIANRAPRVEADFGEYADLADTGLQAGSTAESGAIRRAARREVRAWRELGHPLARVTSQDITADHRTQSLNVRFDVEPGAQAVFGTVTVEGARDVDADFIARQTGIQKGAPFDPDEIDRAQQRLVDLGVFNVVRIEEADAISPDGSLPITVIVEERKPRRVGAGATYSTTDGTGFETFFLHRNLLGQGERLRLDARLSGLAYPIETEDFDYYFGGTFTKPGIFTPDTDLVASLSAERNVLTRYTQTSFEGRLGLSQTFTPQISAEAGVVANRGNFEDPAYGYREFNVLGAYGSATFDTRDSTTNATRGIYLNADLEPYYEANYENLALLMMTEGRAYVPIGPDDRVVLAARLKVGALLGPSIAETPPDRLFFAGGGGSVRGYSYRSIGVDGPGGTITGGKFLTEASAEARVKVTDTIGVVGFVDAGYVTAEDFVGLDEGTKIGAGLGLRYETGLGPLRFDAAVPVNPEPDDPDYALYIGIGQAF